LKIKHEDFFLNNFEVFTQNCLSAGDNEYAVTSNSV